MSEPEEFRCCAAPTIEESYGFRPGVSMLFSSGLYHVSSGPTGTYLACMSCGATVPGSFVADEIDEGQCS